MEVPWFFFLVTLQAIISRAESKPNILILLVDDLGVADIGCFGNDTIRTPNIDKLASEGALLLHSVSAESICSPSRAAILTGRYPIRTGLASNPEKERVPVHTAASGGLPQNETTFAELLSQVGYTTGIIGKWHLGLNLRSALDFHFHPLKHGFHHFYGIPLTNIYCCEERGRGIEYILPNIKVLTATALIVVAITRLMAECLGLKMPLWVFVMLALFYGSLFLLDYSDIVRNFTCLLMRGYEVVEQPVILENLTARFTDDAVKFITRSQTKPFMLYMSYVKVHTPLFATRPFQGHSKHGSYGDNVEEVDWSVGQILDTLDRLGLKDKTFVYFTSDHGPHLEQFNKEGENVGGWKGDFRGGKTQSWEGGIRVPTIVRWPVHIQAGINITEPTINIDILPTILQVAGVPLPTDRIIDGKTIMPLLSQQEKYSPHEFMYHYCAKAIHAVRYRPKSGKSIWKAHFVTPNMAPSVRDKLDSHKVTPCYGEGVIVQDPPLLFDITADPSESHPLKPSKPLYREVMRHIMTAVHTHKESVDPVPDQLENNHWYPWLQICCNFPYCSCVENYTDFVFPEL